MSFKFLFKEDPLIWSHSWCINHAHSGQRKLVRTLTPELFSLHRFEGVRQEILLYCFPLGGGLVVSDLPLFFFLVTAAACRLFPIPKDGPLLYVTGTVRAVFPLSLDVPFLPPLASQRLVRVRKFLGREWKGGSQFSTQGKWGVVPVAQREQTVRKREQER